MAVVVGIRIDDHRDPALLCFLKHGKGRILFCTLFEPACCIQFNGTVCLLDRIQNFNSGGQIFPVIDHAEFFGQIQMADHCVQTAGGGAFQLFPVGVADGIHLSLCQIDPVGFVVVDGEGIRIVDRPHKIIKGIGGKGIQDSFMIFKEKVDFKAQSQGECV